MLLLPLFRKQQLNTVLRVCDSTIYLPYFIVFIIMVFINGLRHLSVGSDTLQYSEHYYRIYGPQSFSQMINGECGEYIHQLLCMVGYKLYLPFSAYLLIMSFFSFFCVFLFIKRCSLNSYYSLLMYLCFGFYILSFSMIRQTMSMSLCMLYFAIKKNDRMDCIRFIVCLIFAIGFHTSAIIIIPAFFLTRLRYSRVIICVMMGIAFLSLFLRDTLIHRFYSISGLISTRYSLERYPILGGGGHGLKLYLLLWGGIVLSIFLTDKESRIQEAGWIYMMFMAVIIFPMVMGGGAALRLVYYYYVYAIVLIPNVISRFHNEGFRHIGGLSVIAIGLLFYANSMSTNLADIMPYHFFWEIP